MTPPLESRDELVAAVNSLMVEVRSLNERMTEFPRREEVRQESRSRAWRFLAFAVAIVLASQLITMTLVSYCFLDANSTNKMACAVMPGYSEAMEQNDIRLGRFDLLLRSIADNQEQLKKNQEDIINMQKQIDKLQGRG